MIPISFGFPDNNVFTPSINSYFAGVGTNSRCKSIENVNLL